MKHSYTITGMTCDSCKEKVSKALSSVPYISTVVIDRESGAAEISMTEYVQTQTMQEDMPSWQDTV